MKDICFLLWALSLCAVGFFTYRYEREEVVRLEEELETAWAIQDAYASALEGFMNESVEAHAKSQEKLDGLSKISAADSEYDVVRKCLDSLFGQNGARSDCSTGSAAHPLRDAIGTR